MTQRWCKVCGGWHDLDREWPHNCQPEPNWNRADFAAPMVARDALEQPLQSMVDGSWHDSKSSLRRTYVDNAEGVRYVEIGNDPARFQRKAKPKPDSRAIRDTVRRAAWEVANGRRVKH